MTGETRTLSERARRVMPGGVSSPVRALLAVEDDPLCIESGTGARLIDADGATLIDYIGSWGAAIAGHAHPAVLDAVERASRAGLGFGATTRLEVELAEEVVARVPGVEQVRFVCSGTEAVMSAVRVARAATGRVLLVRFDGCYHGHADALLASAGSGVATLGLGQASGIPASTARDTIVLPYNDVTAVEEQFAHHGKAIACVIVEPIAGNMGVVPARPAFLDALRTLTRRHDALLIFDEVMTGFRVARGGAQQLTGIDADLVTLGKVIGGGLPVAAYAGRSELMQLVAPAGHVYQAGTLAGSPPGMAAGLATLRLLDESAYRQLDARAAELADGLRGILTDLGMQASVQRVGSMLSVFFGVAAVTDHDGARRADHAAFARFFRRLRRAGVLLPPSGYESWFVSLAHGPAEIRETLAAARDALGDSPSATPDVQRSSVRTPAGNRSVASPATGSRAIAPAQRPGHEARVYANVFELLPDEANPTPLVRINRLNPGPAFSLYAKLEWMNPFGSVKDRAAWAMLRDLEERGIVGDAAPGRGLVEPTSGNTGISLAALASARGYALRAVVPNKVPMEKKLLLRIAGAEVEVINDELCPMPGLGDGSINIARSHARAQPARYAMPNQYANRANVLAHVRTTGPEIWRQTGGAITHLFVSLGTCGTATGLASYLRARNPAIRVIAVQPSEGHDVPGLRNQSQLQATELFDAALIDDIIEIDYTLAYARALDLARQEGLLAGPSSGLILEGARQVIARDPAVRGMGVMIFPDNVFKYTANMVKHLPELASGTTL